MFGLQLCLLAAVKYIASSIAVALPVIRHAASWTAVVFAVVRLVASWTVHEAFLLPAR